MSCSLSEGIQGQASEEEGQIKLRRQYELSGEGDGLALLNRWL
jgi:hypothetical protein